MSLFDDVIVNVAKAIDTAGKVTEQVVDRSRARVSGAELKSKIASQFESLGRYVYDSTLSGNIDNAVVSERVNTITELLNELRSVQDSLATDAGSMTCPKCCCKNSVDSLFCKKCGASLDFSNSYTVPKNDNDTFVCTPKEQPSPVVQEGESAPVTESESIGGTI